MLDDKLVTDGAKPQHCAEQRQINHPKVWNRHVEVKSGRLLVKARKAVDGPAKP